MTGRTTIHALAVLFGEQFNHNLPCEGAECASHPHQHPTIPTTTKMNSRVWHVRSHTNLAHVSDPFFGSIVQHITSVVCCFCWCHGVTFCDARLDLGWSMHTHGGGCFGTPHSAAFDGVGESTPSAPHHQHHPHGPWLMWSRCCAVLHTSWWWDMGLYGVCVWRRRLLAVLHSAVAVKGNLTVAWFRRCLCSPSTPTSVCWTCTLPSRS